MSVSPLGPTGASCLQPPKRRPSPAARTTSTPVPMSASSQAAVVLAPMDDNEIRSTIDRLLAEEHELRTQHELEPLDNGRAARLRQLEESLDQCWDLLRQRRAKREFGLNPDDVEARDTSVVEHYRQ